MSKATYPLKLPVSIKAAAARLAKEDGVQSRSVITAILLGGFVAGTIDIGAAAAINALGPVFILHIIAGGILGRTALGGGAAVAVLGLLLQWAMSLIIAAIFVFAARTLAILRKQWLAAGILYGVPVYLVMNFVVVPLSAWHRFPHITPYSVSANLLAMMLFGAIVSWFASRIPDAAR